MPFDGSLTAGTFDATNKKFGSHAVSAPRISLPAGHRGAGPTFTWEFWFRSTAIPSAVSVLVGNSAAYVGIVNGSGFLRFVGATGSVSITDNVNVCDSAWHHVAICGYDDGAGTAGVDLFLDGVKKVTTATAQTYPSAVAFVGTLSGSNFGFDGQIDELKFSSTRKYTANFTPPAAAYTDTDAGVISLYHFDNNANDSVGAVTVTPTVLPNDAALLYSPYNWDVTSARAKTICAGAYIRTAFKGDSIGMAFDVNGLLADRSQIKYRVGGAHGPWVTAELASSLVANVPADMLAEPWHELEIVFKSHSDTLARWPGVQTACSFLGLSPAAGGAVKAPARRMKNVLIYGDSILEGTRTIGETAAKIPDRNDATTSWGYKLGEFLNAEIGMVGFGSVGFISSGSGGVPKFIDSFGLQWQGVARSFTSPAAPDLVVLMLGTNERGSADADFTAANLAGLNALIAALPAGVPIVDMQIFSGPKAAAKQAAIAGCSDPTRVTYLDTTGVMETVNGMDSVTLHPTAGNNTAFIAPRIAAKLWPILSGVQAPKLVTDVQPTDLVTLYRAGAKTNVAASTLRSYLLQ